MTDGRQQRFEDRHERIRALACTIMANNVNEKFPEYSDKERHEWLTRWPTASRKYAREAVLLAGVIDDEIMEQMNNG